MFGVVVNPVSLGKDGVAIEEDEVLTGLLSVKGTSLGREGVGV